MEFPSFNHHHNRYAPPPPPPPNSFSDNHYPRHHQLVHLPPPPPLFHSLPPPPPPPSLPVLPPPPSYNPHFTFLDAQTPSFPNHDHNHNHNHSRSSPPLPRFSNHFHQFDYRTDSRSDPLRVPQELPNRNPILSDNHHHNHHRHMYSPNPQSESYYSHNDGYASRDIVSQDQQLFRASPNDHRIIDRYASASSVINIDKPTSSSSRNFEDYVDKYEPRYMPMPENERIWDRQREEDPKWMMNGKKNGFGHNDREQSRDYEYESNKFNRVREGREEFKQVQKKSVLLRIGKPNNTHRNRNLVESNNSNVKGKDKDRNRDHTGKDSSSPRIEGDREQSPVDLDVSFQSNGLVAKAVVSPSSLMSDNNHTQPRNKKIKRATEFGSPLSKFSDRLTSSSNGIASSSKKALKHKKTVNDGVDDSLSHPVLDEAGGNGGSGRLSFKLKKKRKLMNLSSVASNFQLAVKNNKSVKSEIVKSSPITPTPAVISFPSLEVNSSKVDESSLDVVSEKDGSKIENSSLDYVNSIGDASTEVDDPTPRKLSISNDGLAIDLNQQPSENEISLNLENDAEKISAADVKLSTGGTNVSDSAGQDQTEIQKHPTESYSRFDATNISYSLCNGSVKTQEVSTTADMNSLDSCSDEIIIVSPENSDIDILDLSTKEEGSQLLEVTSKQTCSNGSTEFPEDVPKESSNAVIIAEDNATPSSSQKESSCNKDEVTEMVISMATSVLTPSPGQREASTAETYLVAKDDLPPSSSIISACNHENGAFVTDSNDKSMESLPDLVTGIVSSQTVSSFSGLQTLTSKSTDKTISDSSIPKSDDDICEKSESKDGALLNCPELFIENSINSIKTSQLELTKTVSSASQGSSVKTLGSNTIQGSDLSIKKPSPASAVPRVFAGRSTPVFANSRINKPTNNITKPRTWHRSTSNPVPLPPKQIGTGQNSYIRSGNTLVRKSAPVAAIASVPPASRSSVYQLNPSGSVETRNNAGSGSKIHTTYSRTSGPSAPVVRPNTPPLSGSTKIADCSTHSRDLPSSPLERLPASPVEEVSSVQKVLEDQNGTLSNSESQKTLDEGKKLHYVKRKSNQLVAASSSDQSVHELDKTQTSASDGYYKRRKNQLIRTSVGDDSVNTDAHKVSKINIKRQSGKGIFKKYKNLRFPSVWTLSSQSLGKVGVSLHQKLRPPLFPWKRSRNWGNVMNNSTSIPSNSSSSSISRKLLLSRKREMIYTRSKHGFSLHMSKLLSVGGSSLKWSKSIERNSRRANEEATLAVAAAEKKKREQNGTACTTAEIKRRNNMSRDRIFRIGLVRYKMDPSRRTLQRISDEEPSTSMQSKEVIRKPYVPKRLKIGHDEYVRIGNGNQLVRNPKRRTRIFANEKVRWSLHTARSRLAKKKKFCQFFTRFGKCNKDDGKCPYIHDSSKIAVCTKFLNGSCSNTNCNLTHKVIPERMQDCSYFSQGLCSNKHCPYRHVNVSSSASICEGFLKGYCADGNECRKKHTYACPEYEATGECPQGTKCKLHHPKNRKMGLKRKQPDTTMEQHQKKKNSRGRYFGSISSDTDSMPMISEKHHFKDNDDTDIILCEEGKFAEYISLDFGNEESGEMTNDQRTMLVSEHSAADFDELTKPIRLMNKIV